ncbi:MAG: capsule assembly Wzi family protein [Acidobacteriaceae bacterium]|jgi:membrane-associated phospholipid phosphatase
MLAPPLAAQTTEAAAALPDAPTPQNQPARPAVRDAASGPRESGDVTVMGTPKRMFFDEAAILTSPRRFRVGDLRWSLALAATTGLLIGTDPHSMTLLHINATDQNRASRLTDGTVGLLGALPAGMFVWSSAEYSPLARETSLLTGESLGDAMILDETGKMIFRRNRPLAGNGQGSFFSSSFSDSSFPSNHAAAAWAMASVIGEEYRGWLPRTVAYTLAATTSAGRVVAEKHFPSDVLVGSALGWLVGHYVYRMHHHYDLTPYLDPPDWREDSGVGSGPSGPKAQPTVKAAQAAVAAAAGTQPAVVAAAHTSAPPAAQTGTTPAATAVTNSHGPPLEDIGDIDPDTIGSPNVPMDSWVYPALERLAAMGFIPSQSIAIRPWTRIECERQVSEASGMLAGDGPDEDSFSKNEMNEAERLLDALKREFDGRVMANESLALEGVYARYGNIAGPALADSFHFGQTWWNDFGRPLGEGGSSLAGFSGYATEGRMFVYLREEMQQGPGTHAYSASTEQVIADVDNNPVLTSKAMPSYVRYRPIEMYAGVAFDGNSLSFGKQELYWGPTNMGPLMFSSNAEPTYSLRFVADRPHPLPFFPNLGTYRFDIVMGKLSGHGYEDGAVPELSSPARPWYNAQKADFNLGQNLELSFTRWSILWGTGHPMTLHSFLRNLYNFSSADTVALTVQAARIYPGAYDSGFDFRYRLPWLSKVVTLYADGYANDDPNPIDAPRRAMWNPGIYFARLPWLPHMDLRVEAVSSEQLAADLGGHFYYYKNYYHDESLNKGFLLGNAIGRDSRAEEGRLGWWVSAQTRVEAGYRQNKGGTQFLPGGSTITDGFVDTRVQLSRQWSAQLFGQYERFLIPSYMAGAQTNKSGWLELMWTPQIEGKR